MRAKQQIDPNAAGKEVLRLLTADATVTAELKDIRAAKIVRREQLKAALTVVWLALESGQVVNGYTTKEQWCKEFAKVTIKTAQRIIFGRKESEATKRSPDTTIYLSTVEFSTTEAQAVVEIEQKHDVKYQGKRRNSGDVSLSGDNGDTHEAYKVLEKENKVVWTHTVIEVDGRIVVSVENEEGTMTEKELVAALRTKTTATLKSMRLWDAKLTEEFNVLVKETADWHEEQAERRSRSAKKAAETRKKKFTKTEEPRAFSAKNTNGGHKPAPAASKVTESKTRKMWSDGKRTFCGKTPGDTLPELGE